MWSRPARFLFLLPAMVADRFLSRMSQYSKGPKNDQFGPLRKVPMITSDTHYHVPTLNLWFLVSSALFLLTMVWTVIDDWNAEWKTYQRGFRELELQKSGNRGRLRRRYPLLESPCKEPVSGRIGLPLSAPVMGGVIRRSALAGTGGASCRDFRDPDGMGSPILS